MRIFVLTIRCYKLSVVDLCCSKKLKPSKEVEWDV